ncbi:DUF2459 domain-containing protein [Pseudorhodobacter sp. E13]|uniref:DUF2459 domain-containing protein n=1 Tax=Pseudorhodobacter sp. E13 TaxID=2487931 RepID=UPI000F8C383B|nr:DUF2459 domain-containing protein [Pseudorhodobacter sp. E13]RUS59917.1 DUF2459 domain-containing protein [Pseudorhodobacter sp. E13]
MIRAFRLSAWTVLVVFTAVFFYIAAGLIGAVLIVPGAPVTEQTDHRIGLISGPIHYDFLLPLTPRLRQGLEFARASGVPVDDPAAEWLIVGWGARGFYTSTATLADMELPILWRAAVGDDAVMRLDLAGRIENYDGIDLVALTKPEAERLEDVILTYIADPNALPLPGFTLTDAFFPAKGHFNLIATCNAWVGAVMRAARLPFGRWTPFPQSIRLSLYWSGLSARG